MSHNDARMAECKETSLRIHKKFGYGLRSLADMTPFIPTPHAEFGHVTVVRAVSSPRFAFSDAME